MNHDLIRILKQANQCKMADILEKSALADREKLEKQLSAINWDELPELIQDYVFHKPETAIPDDL